MTETDISPILQNTLDQLKPHGRKCSHTPFETFCRLLNKNVYGENKSDICKKIDLNIDQVESIKEIRSVEDIKHLAGHHRAAPRRHGANNPIIIVHYKGEERLLDGHNRVNYWFKRDKRTPVDINYHIIRDERP